MTSTIPTLREYGEYLESLDRPIDLTEVIVGAMDPSTGEPSLVELDAARSARAGRRRWLVVAAAALAVVLLAATVLVDVARDDGIGTRVPAGPLRDVSTSPGFDALMASKAAASAPPDAGELVASAWFGGDLGVYLVYADGRMLWIDDLAGTPGWVQRRLTPGGVERVRSELLSSGLFVDGASGPAERCGAAFALFCVRDGGRLLRRRALSGPGTGAAAPGWSPEDVLLRDHLRTLPSSLPATDWVDHRATAYVPSEYQVCLAAPLPRGPGTVEPDPSKTLRALPARAARILRGSRAVRPGELMGGDGCFAVKTGRTQVLARSLVDAYGAPVVAGTPDESSFEIEAPRFGITFMQLLPDGVVALYYRAWA